MSRLSAIGFFADSGGVAEPVPSDWLCINSWQDELTTKLLRIISYGRMVTAISLKSDIFLPKRKKRRLHFMFCR